MPSCCGCKRTNDESLETRAARLRFIFCCLSGIFFFLGVMFGLVGMMVHILSTSDYLTTSYLSQQPYFRTHPVDPKNHQPLMIVIIMCLIGTLLAVIGFAFAVAACSAGRYCCHRKSMTGSGKRENSKTMTDTKKGEHEQEVLTQPLIDNQEKAALPAETATKQLLPESEPAEPARGDINVIGLPAVCPPRHRVPPNGFSYLAHPSEIHSYYQNRPQPARAQSASRLNPVEEHWRNQNSVTRESAL